MDSYEPFLSIAVALALGFVIGLERERSHPPDDAARAGLGGARTFPLYALSGAISTLAAREVGLWIVGVAFTALFVPIALAYADDLRNNRDRGLTSKAAFVLTFMLGVLALTEKVFTSTPQKLIFVSALGVGVTSILSVKEPLHGFARRLSRDDVVATLKFLVVAVIVLPLLPDRAMGPLASLNPLHIGLMMVLIAGIGFVGYVLVRVLGAGRGLGVIGLVGGLVSSTAVTLSMSGRARRDPRVASACALSVLVASVVMSIRLLVVVAVAYDPLLPHVIIPIGALAFGALVVCAVLFVRSRSEQARTEEAVEVSNPFELTSAVKFGALFAIVLMASKLAMTHFGDAGTYAAGAIAGATDVDAISLSVARLARDGLAIDVAATTILIAAAANTMMKGTIALVLGGWRYGRLVLLGFGVALACGFAGFILS